MVQYIVVALIAGAGTYIFFQEYAVFVSMLFTPLIDALSRIPT